MESMFLRLPPGQEQCIFEWCVRDLDFKSMTTSHKGQQSLTKLNARQAAYKWKFFQPKYKYVWLWQEFTLCHTGSHHVEFYVFQKINLQNSSITRNKIDSSSHLLISYPSITQTQFKHCYPRVSSLEQILMSNQSHPKLGIIQVGIVGT